MKNRNIIDFIFKILLVILVGVLAVLMPYLCQ